MKAYRTLGFTKAVVHKQDTSYRVVTRGAKWYVQRKMDRPVVMVDGEPTTPTNKHEGWYDTGKIQTSMGDAVALMYQMHPLKATTQGSAE